MPARKDQESLRRSVPVVAQGAFCVSGPGGDLEARAEEGLFYRDMRHLSKLALKVNGEAPELISSESFEGGAEFALSGEPEGLEITRRRGIRNGMREEFSLTNRTREPVQVRVDLDIDADFADLFEVRGYRGEKPGELVREARDGSLHFAYRREDFLRETYVNIEASEGEVELEPGRIVFTATLDSGEERSLRLIVVPEEAGEYPAATPTVRPEEIPTLETDWVLLARSWRQSVEDLRSLRFRVDSRDLGEVLAAGIPWFVALFGRDSLIACYQSIILGPEIAKNTLRALARRQSTGFDDFRDAEPGKILHELRLGELARFGEIPHSPYYGTVDATPLFLILLNEVWRWTADEEFAREMEEPARKALDWIETHSDSNGDGYADYKTRSTKGLENQGWKDSHDSVLFKTGEQAEPPIAFCEVQGYVYDARMRSAELAEKIWGDADLARKLVRQAGDLKDRFDRDFWVPERGGYYALALDGEGRQVDSITSNMGHLLWSGIIPEDRSKTVAEKLMSPELFSGWGVRTMAEGEGGYDPASYHDGTVWPHDNSLIACGLYRYGHRAEANRIAAAMIEAAEYFDYRLPEVFAGHRRKDGQPPQEYPTTCSPQAWAAGTIPLLVRAMLGLEPDPENRRLLSNSVLPEIVSVLRLENVPAFEKYHLTES